MSLTPKALGTMTAVEIARHVRDKELSAAEVTEAALARMDAFEPHVHAFSATGHDLARAMAKAVDATIAKGEEVGPLAGVPIGIKDLVATKDLVTAMGSMLYKDFTPDEDDIVVERLKEAGAIIIGKTNVPEFGYSAVGHNPVFETTRNPWNLDMTPGGLQRRLRRLGRLWRHAVCDRQRWRRLDPHPIRPLRALRHQGIDGPGAALPGLSRRALSRCLELGIARAYRADEPHRRRFRP